MCNLAAARTRRFYLNFQFCAQFRWVFKLDFCRAIGGIPLLLLVVLVVLAIIIIILAIQSPSFRHQYCCLCDDHQLGLLFKLVFCLWGIGCIPKGDPA